MKNLKVGSSALLTISFVAIAAACSSSSSSSSSSSTPSCADACQHASSVCSSLTQSQCESACDDNSTAERACLQGSGDCNAVEQCAESGPDAGTGSGDGSTSGTDASTQDPPCVKSGASCSVDSDCSDVQTCVCSDGTDTYPQTSDGHACQSGTCNQQALCTSACQSVAGAGVGVSSITYGNCQ